MLKHSRIKRALYDRNKHKLHPFWIVSSYIITALITGLIAVLPQKYTNLEIFFITFIGGILGPLLIWTISFLFRLLFPIKHFSVQLGAIDSLGGVKNPITYFGIHNTNASNNLSIGNLKIKFILPDDSIYGWTDTRYETFIGRERIFLVKVPEDLKLIDGIYLLKLKSSTWGAPYLLIAENRFLYKNDEWDIVKND